MLTDASGNLAARFFGGEHRVAEEDRLSFYEAERCTLLCCTAFGAQAQLAVVIFNKKDGSVHVDFPYFIQEEGILAEFPPTPKSDGPVTYAFGKLGTRVKEPVKYSHHLSGIASFSKSGKLDPLTCPRRQSFRLDGTQGRLFMMHAFWLSGFKQFRKPSKGRTYLAFDFKDSHPHGVAFEAKWMSKAWIRDRISSPSGTAGPENVIVDRNTGAEQLVLFLGQPETHPLRDHLLQLEVRAVPLPTGADQPGMNFLGGWDNPTKPDERLASGSIGFMYTRRELGDEGPAGPDQNAPK